MTQRIHSWFSTRTRPESPRHHLTLYQRIVRRARRIEAQRRPFDWSAYEPLPSGEDLEARDPVEAEAWANIEAEARQRRDAERGIVPPPVDDVLYDIDSVRALWLETAREHDAQRCLRRNATE